MGHDAILGTQQVTDKQVIDRTHPPVIRGKKFRQDGRVLPAGRMVAPDINGEMGAYNQDLASAPNWSGEEAVSEGALVQPVAFNSHYYRCVQAGNTDTSEPNWTTETLGRVADGTVVWEEAGIIHGSDDEGLGVLAQQIDTSVEQVGAVLVHGTINGKSLDIDGSEANTITTIKLERTGIYIM